MTRQSWMMFLLFLLTFKIWDIIYKQKIPTITKKITDNILLKLAIQDDGELLAVGGKKYKLVIFKKRILTQNKKVTHEFPLPKLTPLNYLGNRLKFITHYKYQLNF